MKIGKLLRKVISLAFILGSLLYTAQFLGKNEITTVSQFFAKTNLKEEAQDLINEFTNAEEDLILYEDTDEESQTISVDAATPLCFVNPTRSYIWDKVYYEGNFYFLHLQSPNQLLASVSMYSEADSNSSILKEIPFGVELDYIAEDSTDDFLYVFFDGEYGYIEKKYTDASSTVSITESSELYVSALKIFENSELYKYELGVIDTCQYVDAASGFQKTSEDNHINIGYGIVIDNSWNYQYFQTIMGWSYNECQTILGKYTSGGQLFTDCTFGEINQVCNLIVLSMRKTVVSKTTTLSLSENEVDALVIAYYLHGNLGNFVSAYVQCGNTEALRNTFYVTNANGEKLYPFSIELPHGGSDTRAQDTWEIFHDGNYAVTGYTVSNDGNYLIPS